MKAYAEVEGYAPSLGNGKFVRRVDCDTRDRLVVIDLSDLPDEEIEVYWVRYGPSPRVGRTVRRWLWPRITMPPIRVEFPNGGELTTSGQEGS